MLATPKTMYDIVYPDGNEEAFKKKAKELGFEGVIFLYPKGKELLVKSPRPLRIGFAERKFFERKQDYIINSEDSEKKDNFHYKNTCLNHVHAQLCKKNNISLAFGFSKLLTSPFERQKILGRMTYNMRLARKYDLNVEIFNLAHTPEDMRGPDTLNALKNILRTKFK